jgi:tetratricopeptide (TPR) repeat protein
MSELDVIGTLRKTDKCSSYSWAWDYLRNYEELFARWRQSDINLIEIGVTGGASLQTWHDFFEKATLVGIDIKPECARFARDRMAIRIGSQDDPKFLSSVAAEFPPTIVIDDGSHLAHHMIAAFEVLFPLLLPGGLYVFEDMSFHFEDGGGQWLGFRKHQGLSATPMYDYLSPFIRARAANLDSPKNSQGFMRYAFEHIDAVTVYGGIVAFRKRAPRDFELDVALFERELQQRENYIIKAERYAHYLCKHDIHRDRAENLLREVLKANPRNGTALVDMMVVLARSGNFAEAAQAAAAFIGIDPGSPHAWQTLTETHRKLRRPDLELQVLRHLAELLPDFGAVYRRLAVLYEDDCDFEAASESARKAASLARFGNARNSA